MWHFRSWELVVGLHLWTLRDWVLSGPTMEDRSIRCRQAVKAVAAEDLSKSVLLEMLQWARAAFYMYNPSLLPIRRVYTQLQRLDGSTALIVEEVQRSAVEQAFTDSFPAETKRICSMPSWCRWAL